MAGGIIKNNYQEYKNKTGLCSVKPISAEKWKSKYHRQCVEFWKKQKISITS